MKWPVALLLFAVSLAPAFALDPALPPSGNFDLTRWYLGLPVDESGQVGLALPAAKINTADLCNNGYYTHAPYLPTYAPYFFTGTDGSMVFTVPYNGAAGGDTHSPRCELRETHPDGKVFNWTPLSHGGTHILDATCVIHVVGKGKVGIGQIHAKVPDLPTILLRYDNTRATPGIYVSVKKLPTDPEAQDVLTFEGVPLGSPIAFQLKMVATDKSLIFSCTVNGITQHIDMYANSPDWLGISHYFKAGNYYTIPEKGVTSRVSFLKLVASHPADSSVAK
ncbi:polysaccharide lyase family 7 protein [soil metagenome]